MADRRGKFRVATHLLRDAAIADLAKVFAGIVVCDARYDFERDAMEFLARSERFEKIPDGEIAPEYEVVVYTVRDDATGLATVSGAEYKRVVGEVARVR